EVINGNVVCQSFHDLLDTNAESSDRRLASQNVRVQRDSLQSVLHGNAPEETNLSCIVSRTQGIRQAPANGQSPSSREDSENLAGARALKNRRRQFLTSRIIRIRCRAMTAVI